MKKLNILLSISLMVLLAIPALGQVMTQAQVKEADIAKRSYFQITNQKIRANSYHEFDKDAASRANTSFILDYDSLNDNDAAFFWTMNKNFSSSGDMTYAVVSFDSLANLAGTGYNYDQHTVTVDSIDLFISHRNGSGQNDSLVVSLVELDPVTRYFTSNVLWADTLITNTSLTGAINSFGIITFYPEFALCQGRFGVRVDFMGPTTDTLGIIAAFREDTCDVKVCSSGGPGASRVSNFYPSSYYGYWNGPNLLEIPSPTAGDIYRDCNGDMMFTPGGCEAWYVQDFWIWPWVSIQDTPPTAISVDSKMQTPDDGTSNGTATVSVSGGIGQKRITWVTNPPQTGPTATGLSAGKYAFVVTYGSNCDAIVDTVEVLGNVAIEDLDAGISSLKAFPNPSNGQVNLTLEMEKADNVKVSVYDLAGKLIYSENAKNVRDYFTTIDMTDAVSGIYMLRVETSLGATTRRIVKQ